MFEGRPVLDPESGAPVTVPHYVDDPQWQEEVLAMLTRSGVLSEEGGPEEDEQPEQDAGEQPVDQEAAVQALRERAEHILTPLGVWKPSGMGKGGWRNSIAEVARLALALRSGEVPGYDDNSYKNARVAARRFFVNDPSLQDYSLVEFMAPLLEQLEESEDPQAAYDSLLERYLPEQEQPPAPVREPAREPAAPEPAPEPELAAPPPELEVIEGRLRDAEERAEAAELEARDAKSEAKALQDALDAALARGSAPEPVVPSLALEALTEMVGQHVTVGEGEDIAGVLDMLNSKKERALALAKQIAEIEVRAS